MISPTLSPGPSPRRFRGGEDPGDEVPPFGEGLEASLNGRENIRKYGHCEHKNIQKSFITRPLHGFCGFYDLEN